ncbi:MAG: hypothetical protein ACR2J6_01555 [Thermoleophilaceae bacterium]
MVGPASDGPALDAHDSQAQRTGCLSLPDVEGEQRHGWATGALDGREMQGVEGLSGALESA